MSEVRCLSVSAVCGAEPGGTRHHRKSGRATGIRLAARVGVLGVWRAYEWVEPSTPAAAGEVGERWFGDTLALLHTLYPHGDGCEPEWRWLGVHPSRTWHRWLGADDPSPIWVTPATIDDDIIQAIVSLPRRQQELSALATRVVKGAAL